jgi:hypothetical protein
LGYEKVNNLIKSAEETGWDTNILAKLNNLWV